VEVPRSWALWATLLAVVVLVSVAVLGTSAFASSAPSDSGPLGAFVFSTGLAAYDPAGGYVVWLLSDGSTWASAHGTWSNITSRAGIPTNMESNSQLTYDARDGYLLLFGGESPLPAYHIHFLDDTWAFQGGRWVNLTASVQGAPGPGEVGVMTYDSEDREVVMFGGAPNQGSQLGNATNTTWTYADGVWANTTVPAPRPYSHPGGSDPFVGFTDDPTDGYVLYYNSLPGGCRLPCSAIWSFRGGVWTNRTTAFSPYPRLALLSAFTFDSTSGLVVADSTCQSTPGYTCEHADGTFVLSAGHWKDVTPPGGSPFREENAYSNDPTSGGVIIAGGCCWADFSGLSLGWQDAWVYSNGAWTESAPWGGGSPSWIQNNGAWVSLAIAVSVGATLVVSFRARGPPVR
jgi:hypothetical protein